MADFAFDYFMGSIFTGMVVGIFAPNAPGPVKDDLSLVDRLGL